MSSKEKTQNVEAEVSTNQDKIRVFKSNNKKTERSPDFWGRLNIGEGEYDIALWNNVSKAGNTYLSGFVSESEETDPETVEPLF
tara:strand:- start:1928 stop:2179 length:252 start_codon:yes stop_codon:yes gene_type:complete